MPGCKSGELSVISQTIPTFDLRNLSFVAVFALGVLCGAEELCRSTSALGGDCSGHGWAGGHSVPQQPACK